jgi:hypothetical protein
MKPAKADRLTMASIHCMAHQVLRIPIVPTARPRLSARSVVRRIQLLAAIVPVLLQQPDQMRHAGIVLSRHRRERFVLLAPSFDQPANQVCLDGVGNASYSMHNCALGSSANLISGTFAIAFAMAVGLAADDPVAAGLAATPSAASTPRPSRSNSRTAAARVGIRC